MPSKNPRWIPSRPFTIGEHLAIHAEIWPQFEQKGWHLVSTAEHYKIVRRPPAHVEIKPTMAKPPTADEEVKHFDAKNFSRELAGMNQKKDFIALAEIARQTLALLATEARHGNGEALYHFANLTVDAAQGLSQIAVANPKSVAPVARKLIRWPLMQSQHQMNSDHRTLLDEIELGKECGILADKISKWKPDYAGQAAADLITYMQEKRENDPALQANLKPWHRDEAAAWWSYAKKFLLASYPNPQAVPELARICDTPSRRKSPGRMKEGILSAIQARFIAMAPV